MKKPICKMCVEIHGRDTNQPIQCPGCTKIVGCLWHDKGIEHLMKCWRPKSKQS